MNCRRVNSELVLHFGSLGHETSMPSVSWTFFNITGSVSFVPPAWVVGQEGVTPRSLPACQGGFGWSRQPRVPEALGRCAGRSPCLRAGLSGAGPRRSVLTLHSSRAPRCAAASRLPLAASRRRRPMGGRGCGPLEARRGDR